jgi:hypothetical protein
LKSITKEGKEKKADKHPPLLVAFYQSVWELCGTAGGMGKGGGCCMILSAIINQQLDVFTSSSDNTWHLAQTTILFQQIRK